MTRSVRLKNLSLAVSLLLLALALTASASHAQAPRGPAFLAQHYDISATLDPGGQSIQAIAKVDFVSNQVSGGIRVELNQNLDLKEVKTADGKTLNFERDSVNTLFVTVFLQSLTHVQLRGPARESRQQSHPWFENRRDQQGRHIPSTASAVVPADKLPREPLQCRVPSQRA
jgi:hypothetical protein